MLDSRPQYQWTHKADNTYLEAARPKDLETKLMMLLESFRKPLSEMLHRMKSSLEIINHACCESPIVVDSVVEMRSALSQLRE